MYKKQTPSGESYDTDKNPFALKRLCVSEYNGKRYGAAAVAYDKENDFAVLQYESEEEAKQAVFDMEKDGVIWQSAELGKVDIGGGGTVAKYISKHNIETIDLGVAVIAMHAPYEVVAKVDVYETHRAIKAFYNFDR